MSRTTKTVEKKKINVLAVLAVLAFLVVALIVGLALFTFLFNVVSGIFDGPQIDMLQGLAIWLFLWIIAALFRR